MFCPSCGNEIPDDSTFCSNCGAKIDASSAVSTEEPVHTPRSSAGTILGENIAVSTPNTEVRPLASSCPRNHF